MSELPRSIAAFRVAKNGLVIPSLAAATIGFAGAGLIAGGVYRSIRPPRTPIVFKPEHYNLNAVDINIKTIDGKNLSGWLIDPANNGGKPTDKVLISAHGYLMNRADSSEIMKLAQDLVHNGIAVILFDFRNHGEIDGQKTSDDGLTTLGGEMEQRDVKAVINWAFENGYKKQAFYGQSMGAAAILSCLAQQRDPEKFVVLVVADSSYYHLRLYLRERAQYWNPTLKGPIIDLALDGTEKLTKVKFDNMPPILAVQVLKEKEIDSRFAHNLGDIATPLLHSEILTQAYTEGTDRKKDDVLRVTEVFDPTDRNQHCISLQDPHFREWLVEEIVEAFNREGKSRLISSFRDLSSFRNRIARPRRVPPPPQVKQQFSIIRQQTKLMPESHRSR